MNYKNIFIYYFTSYSLFFLMMFIDRVYKISYTEYIDYPPTILFIILTLVSCFLILNTKAIVLLYFLFLLPKLYEFLKEYNPYSEVEYIQSHIIDIVTTPLFFIVAILIAICIKFFIKKIKSF